MSNEVKSLFKEEFEGSEKKGRQETLFELVRDNILSVTDAAKRAGMNVADFEKAYKTFCL